MSSDVMQSVAFLPDYHHSRISPSRPLNRPHVEIQEASTLHPMASQNYSPEYSTTMANNSSNNAIPLVGSIHEGNARSQYNNRRKGSSGDIYRMSASEETAMTTPNLLNDSAPSLGSNHLTPFSLNRYEASSSVPQCMGANLDDTTSISLRPAPPTPSGTYRTDGSFPKRSPKGLHCKSVSGTHQGDSTEYNYVTSPTHDTVTDVLFSDFLDALPCSMAVNVSKPDFTEGLSMYGPFSRRYYNVESQEIQCKDTGVPLSTHYDGLPSFANFLLPVQENPSLKDSQFKLDNCEAVSHHTRETLPNDSRSAVKDKTTSTKESNRMTNDVAGQSIKEDYSKPNLFLCEEYNVDRCATLYQDQFAPNAFEQPNSNAFMKTNFPSSQRFRPDIKSTSSDSVLDNVSVLVSSNVLDEHHPTLSKVQNKNVFWRSSITHNSMCFHSDQPKNGWSSLVSKDLVTYNHIPPPKEILSYALQPECPCAINPSIVPNEEANLRTYNDDALHLNHYPPSKTQSLPHSVSPLLTTVNDDSSTSVKDGLYTVCSGEVPKKKPAFWEGEWGVNRCAMSKKTASLSTSSINHITPTIECRADANGNSGDVRNVSADAMKEIESLNTFHTTPLNSAPSSPKDLSKGDATRDLAFHRKVPSLSLPQQGNSSSSRCVLKRREYSGEYHSASSCDPCKDRFMSFTTLFSNSQQGHDKSKETLPLGFSASRSKRERSSPLFSCGESRKEVSSGEQRTKPANNDGESSHSVMGYENMEPQTAYTKEIVFRDGKCHKSHSDGGVFRNVQDIRHHEAVNDNTCSSVSDSYLDPTVQRDDKSFMIFHSAPRPSYGLHGTVHLNRNTPGYTNSLADGEQVRHLNSFSESVLSTKQPTQGQSVKESSSTDYNGVNDSFELILNSFSEDVLSRLRPFSCQTKKKETYDGTFDTIVEENQINPTDDVVNSFCHTDLKFDKLMDIWGKVCSITGHEFLRSILEWYQNELFGASARIQNGPRIALADEGERPPHTVESKESQRGQLCDKLMRFLAEETYCFSKSDRCNEAKGDAPSRDVRSIILVVLKKLHDLQEIFVAQTNRQTKTLTSLMHLISSVHDGVKTGKEVGPFFSEKQYRNNVDSPSIFSDNQGVNRAGGSAHSSATSNSGRNMFDTTKQPVVGKCTPNRQTSNEHPIECIGGTPGSHEESMPLELSARNSSSMQLGDMTELMCKSDGVLGNLTGCLKSKEQFLSSSDEGLHKRNLQSYQGCDATDRGCGSPDLSKDENPLISFNKQCLSHLKILALASPQWAEHWDSYFWHCQRLIKDANALRSGMSSEGCTEKYMKLFLLQEWPHTATLLSILPTQDAQGDMPINKTKEAVDVICFWLNRVDGFRLSYDCDFQPLLLLPCLFRYSASPCHITPTPDILKQLDHFCKHLAEPWRQYLNSQQFPSKQSATNTQNESPTYREPVGDGTCLGDHHESEQRGTSDAHTQRVLPSTTEYPLVLPPLKDPYQKEIKSSITSVISEGSPSPERLQLQGDVDDNAFLITTYTHATRKCDAESPSSVMSMGSGGALASHKVSRASTDEKDKADTTPRCLSPSHNDPGEMSGRKRKMMVMVCTARPCSMSSRDGDCFSSNSVTACGSPSEKQFVSGVSPSTTDHTATGSPMKPSAGCISRSQKENAPVCEATRTHTAPFCDPFITEDPHTKSMKVSDQDTSSAFKSSEIFSTPSNAMYMQSQDYETFALQDSSMFDQTNLIQSSPCVQVTEATEEKRDLKQPSLSLVPQESYPEDSSHYQAPFFSSPTFAINDASSSQGVVWNPQENAWVAYGASNTGCPLFRSFPVDKYGTDMARLLAFQWRQECEYLYVQRMLQTPPCNEPFKMGEPDNHGLKTVDVSHVQPVAVTVSHLSKLPHHTKTNYTRPSKKDSSMFPEQEKTPHCVVVSTNRKASGSSLPQLPNPPKSDIPGVYWYRNRNGWVAQWFEKGKNKHKFFSATAFGIEGAKEKAIAYRLMKLEEKRLKAW